jgi:menaquinol-cytochrome c reductase iron-sulfur subunit
MDTSESTPEPGPPKDTAKTPPGSGPCGSSCGSSTPDGSRRHFFHAAWSVVMGVVLMGVPVAAGLVTYLGPLWRRRATAKGGADQDSKAGVAVRVATLEALPADGIPRRFAVVADRVDAWTRRLNVPVGAVYLRRTSDRAVEAFNVICPHAGCFVDYRPDRGGYLCPCHDSTFAVDGSINDPRSPSPRGMDSLAVEIRGQEIWVWFQNFKTGQPGKVPV